MVAICTTSVMVALSVILCRYLGFSPENSAFRFDLGFLPLVVIAHAFGPIFSGLGYLLADMIGSLLSGYMPNPWISLCAALFGTVMGLFFHRRRFSLLRTSLCFLTIGVLVDLLLKTPFLILLYGWPVGATYALRAINLLVNLPVRIFTTTLLMRAIEAPVSKYLGEKPTAFHAYANSFQAVTVPGLARISMLCELLGHPEERLKFIHVAGTNGKGSVCANIASILMEAGYRTGKYISPNLIRVNERISVDGEDIGDSDLARILARLEPLCKEVEKKTGIAPTQFEIWTAAAFVYFEERKCDYVVLEVGLGGEFDATNVISKHEIAVITRLGIDHISYLGSSLADIARAKAGILKPKSTTRALVTPEQAPEAMEVLRTAALRYGTKIVCPTPTSEGYEDIFERFTLEQYHGLVAGIPGYHQMENAALAVKATELLGVSEGAIRRGLSCAKNPARFERISTDPEIIYDGGHNENGIEALTKTLARYYGAREKTVIFAAMADKEIAASLRMLAEGSDTRFLFTTVKENPRALSASALKARAEACGIEGEAYEKISEALDAAKQIGRLTVVCGSLYLYKDFIEAFH